MSHEFARGREAPLPPVFPALDETIEISQPPAGWDPRQLIAVHKIGTSDPNAEMIATGQYDDQGAAIVRKATIYIAPGEHFEMADAAERGRLLRVGAVRYPDATEASLHEKGAR